MPKYLYKSFVAPVLWLALLCVATIIEKTAWGSSGHPSHGLIMFILLLQGAPLFGIAGSLYTFLDKSQHTYPVKQIAITLNVILVGIGAWFWITWVR